MPHVLLVYATTHGHTAKIAARIAETLEQEGASVDVLDVESAAEAEPGDYNAVVVGGSVHAGHHQRPLVDWVKRHSDTLAGVDSAFFSVSLSAAEDTEESREANRKYVGDFLAETAWTPRSAMSFAGALQYREYDFVTRLLMRLLMRRGHHPTDASRDYDYTDWEAVERFAREWLDGIV